MKKTDEVINIDYTKILNQVMDATPAEWITFINPENTSPLDTQTASYNQPLSTLSIEKQELFLTDLINSPHKRVNLNKPHVNKGWLSIQAIVDGERQAILIDINEWQHNWRLISKYLVSVWKDCNQFNFTGINYIAPTELNKKNYTLDPALINSYPLITSKLNISLIFSVFAIILSLKMLCETLSTQLNQTPNIQVKLINNNDNQSIATSPIINKHLHNVYPLEDFNVYRLEDFNDYAKERLFTIQEMTNIDQRLHAYNRLLCEAQHLLSTTNTSPKYDKLTHQTYLLSKEISKSIKNEKDAVLTKFDALLHQYLDETSKIHDVSTNTPILKTEHDKLINELGLLRNAYENNNDVKEFVISVQKAFNDHSTALNLLINNPTINTNQSQSYFQTLLHAFNHLQQNFIQFFHTLYACIFKVEPIIQNTQSESTIIQEKNITLHFKSIFNKELPISDQTPQQAPKKH